VEIGRFGLLHISLPLAPLLGAVDEGTGIYRANGDYSAMRRWYDAVCAYAGPCVSPGAAAIYVRVSRAAVYKRMKAGGLTAFCFHIIGKTRAVSGKEKTRKEGRLTYIPLAECKAWAMELDQRAARIQANRTNMSKA